MGGLECGLFADRPVFFADCGHFVPVPSSDNDRARYTVTNKGVAIAGHYLTLRSPDVNGRFLFSKEDKFHKYLLLPLNCVSEESPGGPFTIILKRIAHDTFVRFLPNERSVNEKYASHGEGTQTKRSTSGNYLKT